jgi:predicted amidohydrolase
VETIRAAAVQFEPVQADKQANLLKIRKFADKAAWRNVQLLVFPECCVTGYWFLRKLSRKELTELAEPAITGPSSAVLVELSKQYNMSIGAGLLTFA